jgi:hypothetical protein
LPVTMRRLYCKPDHDSAHSCDFVQ